MKINTALARELWADNAIRNDELARRLGITKHQLHSLRRWLGLPPRYYRKPVADEISTKEIKRRAAAIRKTWSQEERQKRATGVRRRHWQPPAYDYDHRNAVYTPQ